MVKKAIKIEEVIEDGVIEVKEPIKEVKSNTRICTCGEEVTLPIVGEGPTVCKCGIKHVI